MRRNSRMSPAEAKKYRVLVLGSGARAQRLRSLSHTLNTRRTEIVAFAELGAGKNRLCVRGRPIGDALHRYAHHLDIDEIVIAQDEMRNHLPVQELLDCKLTGIEVNSDTAFLERQFGAVRLETLRPSDLLYSDGFSRAIRNARMKRCSDVLLALLLGFVTLPLMLMTAAAIWLESGAPIFYRQRRVGLHGRQFDVLKFRSMRQNAEGDGVARWASVRDARVTRVGKFIRQCRIDELPQLWNVLQGNMSLIGPRPERPEFVAQFLHDLPFYHLRHQVKPGITGWAQVSYPYGASLADAREKLQFDLYYLKHHSWWLDLSILLLTIQVVLSGKGAR